jgi:membrane protease YdiL (CAAX protease family)
MDPEIPEEPDDQPPGKSLGLLVAFVFELSLGVAAVAIGWVVRVNPLQSLPGTAGGWFADFLIGILAAVPLGILMLSLDRSRVAAFQHLRRIVDQLLLPFFRDASVVHLALIALAAGVGEELFFRGLIQSGLQQGIDAAWGAATAWLAAGVLFGLAHFITRTYALLAGIVGLYLGGLYWWSDSLLIPVVAHAVYDFVALIYLLRTRRTPV